MTTFKQLVEDIARKFENIEQINEVQRLETIGLHALNYPVVQVYLESGELSTSSETHQKTFGGSSFVHGCQVYVDVYITPRGADLGNEIVEQVDLLDICYAVFEAQNKSPYFGNNSIRSFKVKWDTTTFLLSDDLYSGLRFIIEITIF